LSFHVKVDRYRTDDRRKALADGQNKSTKVHVRALRQDSYLDKEGRYPRPISVSRVFKSGQVAGKSSKRRTPNGQRPMSK